MEDVWAIIYVDNHYIDKIEKGLIKIKKPHYTPVIPSIKVLRKKFKGKEIYDTIPLLFNYGFIKIPYLDACNRELLLNISDRVTGIYSWLFKNNTIIVEEDYSGETEEENIKRLIKEKKKTKEDKQIIQVETVKESDIIRLQELSKSFSIHSIEDINSIKEGQFIILHGYPFDNIQAEFIQVINNNKVKVNLLLGGLEKEVIVSKENIYYSIYEDFDDSIDNSMNLEDVYKNQHIINSGGFSNE